MPFTKGPLCHPLDGQVTVKGWSAMDELTHFIGQFKYHLPKKYLVKLDHGYLGWEMVAAVRAAPGRQLFLFSLTCAQINSRRAEILPICMWLMSESKESQEDREHTSLECGDRRHGDRL